MAFIFSRLSTMKALVLRRRWLIVATMALLHIAMLLGIENPWARALLISHLGLFLLWQPFWSTGQKLTKSGLVFIVLACGGVFFWLTWWWVALWLAGLFGLIGGKVISFKARLVRVFYLAAMAYLLGLLLLWVGPHLFAPLEISLMTQRLMTYALPLFILVMVFIPAEDEPPGSPQIVDFFYSLILFMVVMVLLLGSLAFMVIANVQYFEALVRTLFLISAVLLMLGWLWNPRFGFAGLQHFFPGTCSMWEHLLKSGLGRWPRQLRARRRPRVFSRPPPACWWNCPGSKVLSGWLRKEAAVWGDPRAAAFGFVPAI